MPRAFNDSETRSIRRLLQQAGRRHFESLGLRKTSIEALTREAGIGKGSFYRFYDSKEELFFEILEQVQNELRGPMLTAPRIELEDPEPAFRDYLRRQLSAFETHPILKVLSHQDELSALLRNLPASRLEAHRQEDRRFLVELIRRWQAAGRFRPVDPDTVAALLTTLVLSTLHRDFVGERLFPIVTEMLIDMLCDRFFVRRERTPG